MPYTSVAILRDTNGDPIPQYFDTISGTFKPLTEVEIVALAGADVELKTGTATIGRVQIRNNANDANLDPLTGVSYATRVGEAVASPDVNTVLGRLKGLQDGIQLKGSIAEYMWFEGDAEPAPGAGNRAVGIFVNASNEWVIKHWNGTAWGDPA